MYDAELLFTSTIHNTSKGTNTSVEIVNLPDKQRTKSIPNIGDLKVKKYCQHILLCFLDCRWVIARKMKQLHTKFKIQFL